MTNTVELQVDGDSIEIEVEELSSLEQMRWAGKAPNSMMTDGDVDVSPELIEFMIDLVTSQTVLTEELLDDLPQPELTRAFNGVIAYSFGEEPPERKQIDWDGGVDLEDWR